MSHLTETQRQMIFQEMQVINGRKHFGTYDHLIVAGDQTQVFCWNTGAPTLSLILPVMDRPQRFLTTLTRLIVALEYAQCTSEILVMDNSLEPGLLSLLVNALANFRGDALGSVLYHHDPRLTFSTARNRATQELSGSSALVASWDSDIYCQETTIARLLEAWESVPFFSGIAPPLGGYRGEDLAASFLRYTTLQMDASLRRRLRMPGEIAEERGIWHGSVLETAIMRGAFIVKRTLVEQVAARMPAQEPWSRDAVLWSNVPFFLMASELGAQWGYLMRGEAIVLHDDQEDAVAMGTAYPERSVETLKTMMLLCYRNHLEMPEAQRLNRDFLAFNLDTITRVLGCDQQVATRLQQMLLTLAGCLRHAVDPAALVTNSQKVLHAYPQEINRIGMRIIRKLEHKEVFQRVKSLHSLDVKHPIYHLSKL